MTIAKKHAQKYMPNGELSLEQVIQAAIDEAAQSADVPVVQPLTPELATLAYQRAFAESDRVDFSLRIARHVAVLLMPIGSITAAELERLQKIEAVMIKVSNLRFDHTTLPMIREMIDAAIAGETK